MGSDVGIVSTCFPDGRIVQIFSTYKGALNYVLFAEVYFAPDMPGGLAAVTHVRALADGTAEGGVAHGSPVGGADSDCAVGKVEDAGVEVHGASWADFHPPSWGDEAALGDALGVVNHEQLA